MVAKKGGHLAIDAARKAGVTTVVAAKCSEPAEQEYFAAEVAPRLGRGVEWIGTVGGNEKKDLLARARCLVNPIQWREALVPGTGRGRAFGRPAGGSPLVPAPGGGVHRGGRMGLQHPSGPPAGG